MATKLELTVDFKFEPVRQLVDRVAAPKVNRALATAVNGTLGNVRTQAAKQIRVKSSLPAKDVKRGLSIWRATANNLAGNVRGVGKPHSLKRFKPRMTKRGAVAKVWGTRQSFAGAFTNDFLGGHIYKRTSKKRYPIKKLYGPGVAQVMAQEEVFSALQQIGQERLSANVIRQLDRAIAGPKGATRK